MRQIVLSVLISFPAIITAQTMSLDECLRLATDNNVSLRAAKINVDKARLMEGTAWDIDKTDLTLSQDPTSGGSPDNALSVSQTIDFPTRYVARRHQFKAETRSSQSELAVLGNQLHGQVAALYYKLVYERERIRILLSQDTILARYEDIATKRYEAGEVRQLEPLNASRLRHENQLASNMAETEYANTQAELARLIGTNAKVEPVEKALMPIACDNSDSGTSTLSHSPTLTYDYSQTPEGQLAEAQLRVADEAVKVERTGYLPSLTLSLHTQMVIKGWNPYNVNRGWNDGNFMGFEIGVGIPIFNGATRARVRAARKEREQLALQASGEAQLRGMQYSTAINNMLAARNQLDYYLRLGNKQSDKAADISALAYEGGEISYIEYVSAMQQSIDTKLKYASAINDYNQTVIKLMTLSGSFKL